MILKEHLIPIGRINKPHGVHGEMSFSFSIDVFNQEELPFFIMEVDGCFVPFTVEEYRINTNDSGLLKIEGINNEAEVRDFVGANIYVQKDELDDVDNTEISADYFIGFRIDDKSYGKVGVIDDIDQSTENALFIINNADNELLIPICDDYILEIDYENKIILVDLPVGLLEL
ncbi:ribosome maturation factor RimM [Paludibacter sp.]